jgi:hypothetical protein
MNKNQIFVTQSESNSSDIAGKITYTHIMNSIPENKVDKPIENWQGKYETEWRWRFLKIKTDDGRDKDVIEISYVKKNSSKRVYFNRYGSWVERLIDPLFDQFVEKEYYVYSSS